MRFFATPPIDGSLARYVAYDADFCYKLPDHVSFEEGALLEPLSVAVHTCRRSGVQMGQRVLVQGAGPIGTLCMMTARTLGASEVVITDLSQDRLDLAKKLGAEHAICVTGKSPAEVRKAVIEALGTEPDVALECTGAQSSIESAILVSDQERPSFLHHWEVTFLEYSFGRRGSAGWSRSSTGRTARGGCCCSRGRYQRRVQICELLSDGAQSCGVWKNRPIRAHKSSLYSRGYAEGLQASSKSRCRQSVYYL
ncbi:D-xylulose reductase domain protein [Cooperia oncophora]